ncbi:hypothetical protein BDN72DRAFT_896672 [Pluteus cervinus]|uniref:Uncharacterized protein n=1 Tax=Pluteus cervinus TaxID=181527 RepID=A0ACD3AWU9_9AGAR|nr:hypothetical protein BDN72DRAFT_896672 [Pluteus cervinus]
MTIHPVAARPTSEPAQNTDNIVSFEYFQTIILSFELRLKKTEEDAKEREERFEDQRLEFESETRRSITLANTRVEEAQCRMNEALSQLQIANQARLEVSEEKVQLESALVATNQQLALAEEEREQERLRAARVVGTVNQQQVHIEALEGQLVRANGRAEECQRRLSSKRWDRIEWTLGVGAGCLLTGGGFKLVISFGMTASIGTGLGGLMAAGGVLCLLDKVLSDEAKELLMQVISGIANEVALVWLVRGWMDVPRAKQRHHMCAYPLVEFQT